MRPFCFYLTKPGRPASVPSPAQPEAEAYKARARYWLAMARRHSPRPCRSQELIGVQKGPARTTRVRIFGEPSHAPDPIP
jgi:hypothetical protein